MFLQKFKLFKITFKRKRNQDIVWKNKGGKEICINKDVLSRISLATSNSIIAGEMPHIIILPQPQFRIIKDYKTVEKFTRKEAERKIVDYKLVDYQCMILLVHKEL